MKKMKCFVSLLIALTIIMTSAVFMLNVNAEETLPSVSVTDEDWLRVEKLEAFGAITNEYEDIGMYVTRRQMVDIIVHYMRIPAKGTSEGKSPFVDVLAKDSSIDAIMALYNLGVITGDENLKFHPDNYLTYDEAMVFVINAVGHKIFAAREGGYPTGYHRIAIKNGMLSNLKFDSGKEYIPLCDVYKLLESAGEIGAVIPQVFTDNTVDYRVSAEETYLSDVYGIEKFRGIITGNENTHLDSAISHLTDEMIEIDGKVYETPGYVYATSLGRAVDYYLRKADTGEYVIAYIEENDRVNELTKIDSEDLLKDKITDERIYYSDENEKEYHIDVEKTVKVIYNNRCWVGYGTIDKVLPSYGYIEALDNNGDEECDVLFVYDYKNIVVDSVDTYKESVKAKFTDDVIKFDSQNDKIVIRLMPDDRKMTLNALTRGDVITVMESKGTPKMYTIYVSRDSVEGMIEEVSSVQGYMINGTFYELSPGYSGLELKVGIEAEFYLDFNGKIVAADRGESGGKGDFGVLMGLDYSTSGVDTKVRVKLFTAESTFVTATLADNVKIDEKRFSSANGTEKAEALKRLSGGAQNDEGHYIIDSASVVKYIISGDELIYLDTGKTGEDGNLRMVVDASNAETGSSMLVRYNDIVWTQDNGGKRSYFTYAPEKIYVFIVPTSDRIDVEAEYSVERNLVTHKYYRKGDGKPYTNPVSGYYAYDHGKNDESQIDAIMVLGGTAAIEISNQSPLNVVSKITTAVDEDGLPSSKMYLNENASYMVAETVKKIEGLVSASNVSGKDIANYIKPGMVVSYGTDADGAIQTLKVFASYDAESGDIKTFDMSASNYLYNVDDGIGKTAGTVVYNDLVKNVVTIEPQDALASNALVYSGVANIMIYRTDTGKVTSGSVASFAEGDFIVARLDDYYRIREVIIYKK